MLRSENEELNLIHCAWLSIYFLQIMQSIGFLGPAFFLTQLSHIDSPAMAVLCMACSQVNGSLASCHFPLFCHRTAIYYVPLFRTTVICI